MRPSMVTVTNSGAAAIKTAIDDELDRFQEWFQKNLDNSAPLVRSERAILATYLAWKLKGEPESGG